MFKKLTQTDASTTPILIRLMTMIAKPIVVIAFLCIPVFNMLGQSQSFAPIGARWHYRPHEFAYQENTLYTFTVTKDTILDGAPAKELSCAQWTNGQLQDSPDLNKYVYSNSDSVFYYVDNQWELLFDFTAQPGDTIRSKVEYFGIFNGCMGPDLGQVWDFAYRIDSVAVEHIGGAPLRVQYVSSICPGFGTNCWRIVKIVERIGVVDAGYWWGQGDFCIAGGFPGYLRCYEDDLIHYMGSIGNTPCDYVTTNEIDGYQITIAPNPTTGILQVSFSPLYANLDFKVFDNLGRILNAGRLMVGDTSFQISLESAPSGIFYLEFVLKNQIKTYKIVKL